MGFSFKTDADWAAEQLRKLGNPAPLDYRCDDETQVVAPVIHYRNAQGRLFNDYSPEEWAHIEYLRERAKERSNSYRRRIDYGPAAPPITLPQRPPLTKKKRILLDDATIIQFPKDKRSHEVKVRTAFTAVLIKLR